MSEILPQLRSGWLNNPESGMKMYLENMIKRDHFDDISLRQSVENLHDGFNIWDREGRYDKKVGPPKIVFVTATSAIPYAFSIKEAWKTAYQCPVPKFFTIDVSDKRLDISLVDNMDDLEVLEVSDAARLKKQGNRYGAFGEAALFDEYNLTGATLSRAQDLLEKSGFYDLRVLAGQWGSLNPYTGITRNMRPVVRADSVTAGSIHKKLLLNINPESTELVHDMKVVGRAMGEEIIRRRVLTELG